MSSLCCSLHEVFSPYNKGNDGSTVAGWYERIYCENSNCLGFFVDEGCYKSWHGEEVIRPKSRQTYKNVCES